MKVKSDSIEGIEIEYYTYQYKGFAESQSWHQAFQFDSFLETKDSLYFYNVIDTKSMETTHLDSLKLNKGEVYIRENRNYF